jgi:hypothetical protein
MAKFTEWKTPVRPTKNFLPTPTSQAKGSTPFTANKRLNYRMTQSSADSNAQTPSECPPDKSLTNTWDDLVASAPSIASEDVFAVRAWLKRVFKRRELDLGRDVDRLIWLGRDLPTMTQNMLTVGLLRAGVDPEHSRIVAKDVHHLISAANHRRRNQALCSFLRKQGWTVAEVMQPQRQLSLLDLLFLFLISLVLETLCRSISINPLGFCAAVIRYMAYMVQSSLWMLVDLWISLILKGLWAIVSTVVTLIVGGILLMCILGALFSRKPNPNSTARSTPQ